MFVSIKIFEDAFMSYEKCQVGFWILNLIDRWLDTSGNFSIEIKIGTNNFLIYNNQIDFVYIVFEYNFSILDRRVF